MDGIILTSLKKIYHPKGEILKAITKSDSVFSEFGEAYFSVINQGDIKGWKKHTKMISNLIVITGEIEFVFHNEITKEFFNIKISQNNYKRLTIKPGLLMAFRGIKKNNILFNLSNIEHDPNETINIDLNEIDYRWSNII
jgi:dTDP-4-dehydrorhamnose 3,5-epimerase